MGQLKLQRNIEIKRFVVGNIMVVILKLYLLLNKWIICLDVRAFIGKGGRYKCTREDGEKKTKDWILITGVSMNSYFYNMCVF